MLMKILSVIVVALLIASFARGPGAISGGATSGLIIGALVALVRTGFQLSTIWAGLVIGTLFGAISEVIASLSRHR
ncbi:MAG: hypothetical protein JRI45_11955 [Deltaproteobacteria bacterium]|nr:hypothetical protein [Deltaproteobacteria bacterium]